MSVIYHLQDLAQLMRLGKRLSYGAALKSKGKVVRPKTSMLLLYQYANLERLVFWIVQRTHDWVGVLTSHCSMCSNFHGYKNSPLVMKLPHFSSFPFVFTVFLYPHLMFWSHFQIIEISWESLSINFRLSTIYSLLAYGIVFAFSN